LAQVYTVVNQFAPTSASSITVGHAVNLTTSCSVISSALCKDINSSPRPATGAWNAGAYEFPGPIPPVLQTPTAH
jgi:hypothetical protein